MKAFELDNFINDERNKYILNLSGDYVDSVLTINNDIDSKYRISKTKWRDIKEDNLLTEIALDIIDIILAENINYDKTQQELYDGLEQLQIVKYSTGGHFSPHTDSYSMCDRILNRQGQRFITGMIYLNDDFTGGHTKFTERNLDIIPKKNKLLLFTNCKKNMDIDFSSMHSGMPVLSGEKYICNFWFNEK